MNAADARELVRHAAAYVLAVAFMWRAVHRLRAAWRHFAE